MSRTIARVQIFSAHRLLRSWCLSRKTYYKCSFLIGTTDKTVSNLADQTLRIEFEKVSSRIEEIELKSPSLALNRRKAFSLIDFGLQCTRLFQITFIANVRTFLFNIFLFIINFLFVAAIFSSSAVGSACYPQNMNVTIGCDEAFDQETKYKENLFNIAYTLLYVGFIMTYMSTMVFSTNVKFFRNEYRNCRFSCNLSLKIDFNTTDYLICRLV